MKIAVIGGDGTGPEVAAEGVKVLQAVAALEGFSYELTHLDWGGDRLLKTGEALPEDGLEQLRQFDTILLGAVGHPDVAPGILERKLLVNCGTGALPCQPELVESTKGKLNVLKKAFTGCRRLALGELPHCRKRH